ANGATPVDSRAQRVDPLIGTPSTTRQEATLAAAEESVVQASAMPGATAPGQLAYAAQLVALAAVYVAAGKLGIALRVAHGVITPVWIPTGLAIAALFIFGARFWPAVAVGALVTNA